MLELLEVENSKHLESGVPYFETCGVWEHADTSDCDMHGISEHLELWNASLCECVDAGTWQLEEFKR